MITRFLGTNTRKAAGIFEGGLELLPGNIASHNLAEWRQTPPTLSLTRQRNGSMPARKKTTADTNIDSLCPVRGGEAEMGCPCRCSSVHDVGNFAKIGTVVSVQRPGEYV